MVQHITSMKGSLMKTFSDSQSTVGILTLNLGRTCADPESFARGGPVEERRDDPNTTISGPTSVHQRNAI